MLVASQVPGLSQNYACLNCMHVRRPLGLALLVLVALGPLLFHPAVSPHFNVAP